MPYTQSHIYLALATPLGADTLQLRGFQGEEQISNLFCYTLDLLAERRDLDLGQLVGQPATITMQMGDGTPRFISGIVARCVQAGSDGRFTRYVAELRPWLWLLTLISDSRIFQHQSAPDLIAALFDELGFKDYRRALSGSYAARDYCVQYAESSYAFVARLLEDEGISYFFEHTDGKHTLVLADSADAHPACPGLARPVRYQSAQTGDTHADAVTDCSFERQVTAGQYTVADFNFETPGNRLSAQRNGTNARFSQYEYPANFLQQRLGDQRVRTRLEGLEVPATLLRGAGFAPGFTAGYRFGLVGYERAEANTSYVLWRVCHQATTEAYTNSFDAFPVSTPFRPARVTPRPSIPGTQTALVVGASGQEIYTDSYGRVKVQFHWDRRGKSDENSSCWIRVAHGWAGAGWGQMFLPRVGQEVVVTFLEGNPDRPLITGSVYNAQQTVPYSLPNTQTRSTIKSKTVGGAGSNEISFEDKSGAEQLCFHAQRDMITLVEHDRSATIKTGNEALTVEQGTRTLSVAGDETHTNKANYTQEVSGDFTLKVSGNLTIDVRGAVTIQAGQDLSCQAEQSLTNKAGASLTNQAGQNLTNKAGASLTNQAAMSLTNQAEISLTNKGGTSQTVESEGILSLKGTLVKVN